MRGPPSGGIESGQWARGTMAPPPGSSMQGAILHKAEASYKVLCRSAGPAHCLEELLAALAPANPVAAMVCTAAVRGHGRGVAGKTHTWFSGGTKGRPGKR